MGSIVGSVGAKFGARVPATGALVATTNYILTSLYLPVYPTIAGTQFIYVAFEYGWRAFNFQGVGGGAEINATMDGPTAQGQASMWVPVGVGTGNGANPVVAGGYLFTNTGPWAAFQIVPSGAGGYILFGAGG